MFTILINPEHGWNDPGAVYEEWTEARINQALTHLVEGYLTLVAKDIHLLNRYGFFEREEPIARVQFANAAAVDLMVTLSVNSGGGSGLELYISPQAYTSTRQYAKLMVDRLGDWYTYRQMPIRGIFEKEFTVLEKTEMPSLLIETGFIDNALDRSCLTRYWPLVSLAQRIGDGILRAKEYKAMVSPEN